MQNSSKKNKAVEGLDSAELLRLCAEKVAILIRATLTDIINASLEQERHLLREPLALQSQNQTGYSPDDEPHIPDRVKPLLVDTQTACALLSCGRTKLFSMLNQPDGLQRVKLGRKTLIKISSIQAVIARGGA